MVCHRRFYGVCRCLALLRAEHRCKREAKEACAIDIREKKEGKEKKRNFIYRIHARQ
jgi:hypothetical protein